MAVLNFGSCCIDNVYAVPHFVTPGETLPCDSFNIHPGGKGLNQSIALACAGAEVRHAGRAGKDGQWLVDLLTSRGVDTSLLVVDQGPTGHANIQVTPKGENAIVLFGGANRRIDTAQIDTVLSQAAAGDILLLQNEISHLGYLIEQASSKSIRIVFNAAPMTDSVKSLPLAALELLIINEGEGQALTGSNQAGDIIESLQQHHPELKILLTLGSNGSIYADKNSMHKQSAESVAAIDTTGAGDTFTGYFLAGYSKGLAIQDCLQTATRAAALCVTRPGAANSIPFLSEL
ncbi:MAG: ribokinase [Candidatus Azotimanducaceae bacterium]|jgi:ribokinase